MPENAFLMKVFILLKTTGQSTTENQGRLNTIENYLPMKLGKFLAINFFFHQKNLLRLILKSSRINNLQPFVVSAHASF